MPNDPPVAAEGQNQPAMMNIPMTVPPTVIPTMDWDSADKATAFRKFQRKCEHLFKSYYKNVPNEERVTYILLWLGDEGDDTYRTFTFANEDEKVNPETVMKMFSDHFEPVATHRVYRYELMNKKQGSLPVDLYVKELRTIALKCKYKDSKDMEVHILDQVIWSCSHKQEIDR